MNRSLTCLTACWLLQTGSVAANSTQVIPGQSYDLELSDGTRLKNAVYHGKKGDTDSFEVKSVVGLLQVKEYRILTKRRDRSIILTGAAQYQIPFNQQQLGFSEAIGGALSLSLPVFADGSRFWPRLFASGGFTRFSGSKALLSGPEATGGFSWLLELSPLHHIFLHTSAGAGFYRLLNQNLSETFDQTTFIAVAEAGYALRFQRWGVSLSYVQQYIHDQKLPLNAGGVRFGAVYFGGNV